MREIYLDNNATTKVAPEVVEAMLPFFTELYANPSSMHSFGEKVSNRMEEARDTIGAFLGADSDQIVITSCGSESDSMAIRGVLEANPDKRHIITTKVEHPAVLNLGYYLSRRGYQVTYLPVDKEGLLDLAELEAALSPHTAIVSIMWANNETGVIFPVEEIAALVKKKAPKVVFHTDAVQAAGKIPINMKESQIDLLSISGHKLHAPKGIGVLYIRRGTKIVPLLVGGHQENGRRAGTENVPYIIGLAKACELASQNMTAENNEVRRLRDKLENGLLSSVPECSLNGHKLNRLPNTTNISFAYIEGEAMLLTMSSLNISASSGSACTSGSLSPSHVLRALGVPFTRVHGSVRFSLSRYNTEADIDYVLENMPKVVEKLRKISPFWKPGESGSTPGN